MNCDIIALSAGDEKCCVCVLQYRKGRLCGSTQHIIDSQADFPELLSQFIVQYYTDAELVPKEIFVNMHFDDRPLVQKFLSELSGKNVTLTVPQKSEKKRLVLMAQNNAAEGLAAVLKANAKEIAALDELMRLLSLASPPKYIESYDISNLGDKYMVGGMVVFENGRPLKSAYKKFTIKDQLIQDDYSAMRQVLRRRFTEYLNAKDISQGFGRLPDLILLDGGRGHVSAVLTVLEEFNISVPIFGMVKDSKHRTRAIAGDEEIAITSSRSAYTLISKIQNEVHRYSISFQKKKHKTSALVLNLTQVEGIGKAKAYALFSEFKTIKNMKNASIEDLCSVKGITPELAKRIKQFLDS